MREASALFGRVYDEDRWRNVVKLYHQGSKELFKRLYPAYRFPWPYQSFGEAYWGVLQYALVSGKMEPWYNSIAFQGIAAGYQQEQEYELEFVEAVERAYDWDYDQELDTPQTPEGCGCSTPFVEAGCAPFVARICRVLPVALSFVGKGAYNWQPGQPGQPETAMSNRLCMSGDVRGAAGLREALSYGELLTAEGLSAPHDLNRFIVEGNGHQWILTNGDFGSDWVPGFWEEAAPEEIPFRMKFSATVFERASFGTGLFTGTARPQWRWTVSRKEDRLLVMANRDVGVLELKFPVRHLKYSIQYQDYKNHRWDPPRVVDSGEHRHPPTVDPATNPVIVSLPQSTLNAKSLAIVDVRSDDYRASHIHFGEIEKASSLYWKRRFGI